ncbi:MULTISPECIES: hypothetical protein [Streptomyces]|uniref:hypothetical protein n=1 Tax=Streptomyces TaxID=1883 RepID=UPI0015878BC5|nr:hypothetical protein [Streptomyces sp. CAI-85]MBO7936734.1 hypothetical protein [Streptomyces sp. S9]NUV61144.1 hypothetical protein [Streptomyces sp. CAI-85]
MSSLPSDTRTARRIVTYAFWLMTTLSFVAGLALLLLDKEASVEQKLSSIGSGIVSAALFAAFVTLFVNRESNYFLRHSLTELFREQRDATVAELTRISEMHMPTREYPPTDHFDSSFMSDLMKDFKKSSEIQFRGSTGKWIAPYVNYCSKAFTEVHVLMLDPSNIRSLRRRAADRMLIPSASERTIDEIVEELRNEIARTLIALFDLRNKCKVCVSLDGTLLSVVRLERTDEAVYVALYHANPGRSTVNPTTYRYSHLSLAYQTYSLELSRQLETAERRVTFDHRDNESDLMSALDDVGLGHIDSGEVARLRLSAKEFERRFFVNMRKVA